jgi:phosphatidylglycerol:prolipoprotein diacylglycerol transferase
MFSFWHNYWPQPIIFSLGPLALRWYGVIIVLAIVLASLYARRQILKKQILNGAQFEDLLFYLIIFGLVGARFGHVIFFNWNYYARYPAEIIKIWQGGLSIQGAVLFALLTLIVWARRQKINFLTLLDCLVPALALGQAIGRWGNYFNQELFGRPTNGWWGIPIEPSNRILGFSNYTHFQPTFFYESILNLLLFFTLHRLLLKNRLKTGTLALFYFGGYSLIRFFMEFIRIDETPLVLGLRLPQVISLLVILVVIILLSGLYLRPLSKAKK